MALEAVTIRMPRQVSHPSARGGDSKEQIGWVVGCSTILTSAVNFNLYLTTGKGLTSRTGRAMEGDAACI